MCKKENFYFTKYKKNEYYIVCATNLYEARKILFSHCGKCWNKHYTKKTFLKQPLQNMIFKEKFFEYKYNILSKIIIPY